jgi:hypothetical protein
MNATELATLTTTGIAVVIAVIPPLGKKLASLPDDEKAAVKGGVALLIGVLYIILSCGRAIQGIPCELNSIADFVYHVIVATVLGFGSLTAATLPYEVREGRKERSLRKEA